jgi:hypothetical protein
MRLGAGRHSPTVCAVAAALSTTDGSLFVGTRSPSSSGWSLGRDADIQPGVYRQGTDGPSATLEFRSQPRSAFASGAAHRLAFSHLSNAGLGSRNPGQESLTINYEWGLSR